MIRIGLDIDELLSDARNNLRVTKLLNWLQKQSSEHRVFLIGSTLEKYTKEEYNQTKIHQ